MDTLLTLILGGVLTGLALIVAQRYVGFRSQAAADYTDGPPIDIRTALSGPILCEGVIYGPTGKVSSRFVADMHGRWDGNKGVLSEDFRYDSGSQQSREWRLTLGNDGAIRAEADDLVAPGTGQQTGSALRLDYTIRLPESAGGHALDVTDWMYMVENGTVVNRSQFRKYGIKVAELVATMRKVDA
ncbi:DUF3833 domain-containing protein [Roseicitreum antarcticum]|uniref:DUF3833 domain-containing protein n=1 Tax=Roseicitreum antarcticum TaxID=564137 RepID=A0A1H3ALM4_9RHOB|nr:DUF3833 domain-containing protein [Roseicitreum antarcticum]SDX30523.1 Protein of unknown function [Roseicitreum antarcticum]